MLNAGERLDKVEQRLGSVERRLGTVEKRLGTVEKRLGTLDKDVQKLRVLEEDNAQHIKLIAEVQVQHGGVLQQIVQDIEPLKAVPELLRHVVHDHERRIAALEGRPRL